MPKKFLVLLCCLLAMLWFWGCVSNNEQLARSDEPLIGNNEQSEGDEQAYDDRLSSSGDVAVFPQLGDNTSV